jgi:hypothetical protein
MAKQIPFSRDRNIHPQYQPGDCLSGSPWEKPALWAPELRQLQPFLKIYKQVKSVGEFTWKRLQEPSRFAEEPFPDREGGKMRAKNTKEYRYY